MGRSGEFRALQGASIASTAKPSSFAPLSPNSQGFLSTSTEGTEIMLGKISQPLAALVFCAAVLFAVPGKAQLPWPNAPSQNAPAAWPTAPSGTAASPAAASPPPTLGMPGAAPMTPVPQAGGGGGAGAAPCMAEFTKLQAETDKYGKATKDASSRKAPREEMCKRLTLFAAAIGKWAKYSVDHAASCGIPSKVIEQLKAGASHIAKSKEQVCATAAGGPAAAQTLSDALGQTIMPTTEPKNRPSVATGTLDTLTGVTIGR